MKKKNILVMVGALGVALVLIVGSNVMSGKSVISDVGGVSDQPTAIVDSTVAGEENDDAGSVELAPNFTLPTLKGDTISLSDYRDKKPVVLDFFATWCPNCQRDMPRLSKMYEKYGDQVEVIGVDLREDKAKVQQFIDSKNILFPIVIDADSAVSRAYGIRYTNYHVLINKDGSQAGVVPGDMTEERLLQLIAANQ